MKLYTQKTLFEEFPSLSIKKGLEGLTQEVRAELVQLLFRVYLGPHDI